MPVPSRDDPERSLRRSGAELEERLEHLGDEIDRAKKELDARRQDANEPGEALAGDWMDDMRGLADERDAVASEASRRLDGQRKHAATLLDSYLSEDRVRAPLDFSGESRRVEIAEMLRLGRFNHADKTRAQSGQRHHGERAGFGVELSRDAVVRPCVGKIERERALRIAAVIGRNAGRGSAKRFAAVGCHDETCP